MTEEFKGVVLDQFIDDTAGHTDSSFQVVYEIVKINANDLLIYILFDIEYDIPLTKPFVNK